jgi:GntR family transcriptional regulator
VIEFHLDGHSKVATYMQLVLQVKQSLRTGLLEPGDQLPKVREVTEALAINPNTVLKAYRELEYEGLAVGRPGLGTFITRSLGGESLASHKRLQTELRRWLGRARAAGLDDDSIAALFDSTVRASSGEEVA